MALAIRSSGVISDRQVEQFRELGYFIIEEFFTMDEVEAVQREITRIVDQHPNLPGEMVQMEPVVRRGERVPETKELGVRKLFRMAVHNDFFRQLAFYPKMVEIAAVLLGPDIKLLQSMLLMKPPHFGGSKIWHQDNAYFRLVPNDVFGFWVACDDTDPANGCMHILPGSHTAGVAEHSGMNDDYGLSAPPSLDRALACPLNAGGALIFHGELCHFTPDNTTDRRRRAVQYHYASTRCRPAENSPFPARMGEILVAGREYEGCI
ncbi:MAG: phytanoyl-CoA dioxygenase family protein [Candidatus Latescibacteria bacterium]|nr:phytanoyl-CoA dioxygenase family protein [Candidatus Latescibacterota bacterium]